MEFVFQADVSGDFSTTNFEHICTYGVFFGHQKTDEPRNLDEKSFPWRFFWFCALHLRCGGSSGG